MGSHKSRQHIANQIVRILRPYHTDTPVPDMNMWSPDRTLTDAVGIPLESEDFAFSVIS